LRTIRTCTASCMSTDLNCTSVSYRFRLAWKKSLFFSELRKLSLSETFPTPCSFLFGLPAWLCLVEAANTTRESCQSPILNITTLQLDSEHGTVTATSDDSTFSNKHLRKSSTEHITTVTGFTELKIIEVTKLAKVEQCFEFHK